MDRASQMIDYIGSFYSQEHARDTFAKGIDSLLGSHRDLKAYLFPIYMTPSYWDNLRNGRRNFRLLSQNEGICLFETSFQVGRSKQKRTVTGNLFVVENPQQYQNIYTVISIETSAFFPKRVLSHLTKAYPWTNLAFITHKGLKNLLIGFRDTRGLELAIVRATSHSRVGKRIMTTVSWPKFSIEGAFEWVASENGWFRNLTFRAKSERPLTRMVEISISRNGVMRTNGYLQLIYEDFVLPISRSIYENVSFFSKRARLDDPARDVHPLSIEFGDEQLTGIEENQRLISAMKTMKSASVSVLHGNPHIHLSVLDYYDGSSFDVWVLSTDKIIIVPQLKASFQSIKRLINHIFDNYGEGDIKNYEVG